jgi:hypothetical protein
MCLLFSGIRWLPCYVFSAFMQSPEQPVRQVRCDRFSRDEGKEAGIGLYGLISSIPLLPSSDFGDGCSLPASIK